MNEQFLKNILNRHRHTPEVPSTKELTGWVDNLLDVLFPEHTLVRYNNISELKSVFAELQERLVKILKHTKACPEDCIEEKSQLFLRQIPGIYEILNTDVQSLVDGDPAAYSEFEVIRAYPGFYAVFIHRIAHALYKLDIPLIPRILSEHAHTKAGVDIHPAASIGASFFIDHGTGVVIGETCQIGNNVKIYQGVTLGALSIHKNLANTKRHPTVEDDVVIYAGATILGGDTVIGKGSIIGGNVWLTHSVPPYSRVYHQPDTIIKEPYLTVS